MFPEGTCFLAGFPSCSNLVAIGSFLFLKGTTARGDQSSNSLNGRNVIRPIPRNRSKRLSWCTAEGIACPDDRKLMCIPLRWRYQVNHQSHWGTNPSRDVLYIYILHIYINYIYVYTSSTAQGGGGSFKNRKPIGKGWLLWITDGRANPLMDRKVVGVVFAGMVAMVAVVTSPTTAGCSVMYCNCSCSCSVVEL